MEAFRDILIRRITQLNARFATCCVFVGTIIAISARLISNYLYSFTSARFRIGKITRSIRFRQVRAVRCVALIMVFIASNVFVITSAIIRRFLVMSIAFLRTRFNDRVVQEVSNITRPYSISRVVLITFFSIRMGIRDAIVMEDSTICRGLYVAVTRLIMLISSRLLIFFMFFFGRLFQTRRVGRLILFINLLRSTLRFLIYRSNVSISDCLVRLRLFFLIGRSICIRLVLISLSTLFGSISLHVLRALIIRISFGSGLNAIGRI